jgi:hypothetical protein
MYHHLLWQIQMAEQSLRHAEDIGLHTTVKTDTYVDAESTVKKVLFKKYDYLYLSEKNSDTALQKGNIMGEVTIITGDGTKYFTHFTAMCRQYFDHGIE